MVPTSNSRLAFEDCYEILNIASEDDNGARVQVSSHADAMMLRTRLHTARRIDRTENMKTYDPTHPMYGKSMYDKLVVRLKNFNGNFYVYVERVRPPSNIQLLSEVEGKSVKLLEPAGEVTVHKVIRRA